MLLVCTKLHNFCVAIATIACVQEHVVLANIKALDLCMCGCMYTHAITHTHHNAITLTRIFMKN